jgi:hypothetical protein
MLDLIPVYPHHMLQSITHTGYVPENSVLEFVIKTFLHLDFGFLSLQFLKF